MNTFQPIEILRAIPKILQAFPMTMLILLSSLLFSLLIGAAFAMMSLSRHKALNAISKGYVSFMRGIPTLILIFLIYLGLPQLLKQIGVDMSGISLTAYIIACLSLSVSANMSEMMRSAYLAVDKGQREAAWSVGMTIRISISASFSHRQSGSQSRHWATTSSCCLRKPLSPLPSAYWI